MAGAGAGSQFAVTAVPVLLATAAMLVGIAALACYVPSGRAASVPPASALRAE